MLNLSTVLYHTSGILDGGRARITRICLLQRLSVLTVKHTTQGWIQMVVVGPGGRVISLELVSLRTTASRLTTQSDTSSAKRITFQLRKYLVGFGSNYRDLTKLKSVLTSHMTWLACSRRRGSQRIVHGCTIRGSITRPRRACCT